MEQYTTKCGVELPQVDPEKNYDILLYKIGNDWEEFLRCDTMHKVTDPADEDFRKKIAQAACTMYTTRGIGIAANQLGFKEHWCIVDTQWPQTGIKVPRVILNPNTRDSVLVETQKASHEGCLSVPMGFKGTVARHSAVDLYYTDLMGNDVSWQAFDLDAAAVLHELDHLRGRLFIDNISNLRLSFLEGKLRKVQKMVRNRIKNNNRSVIAQVKRMNIIYSWSAQKRLDLAAKEAEKLVVEQPEVVDE